MNIDEEDDQIDEQQPNLQPQQGVQAQDVLPNIAVPLIRRRGRGRGKIHSFLLQKCLQVYPMETALYHAKIKILS